jgi:hypothetical protein
MDDQGPSVDDSPGPIEVYCQAGRVFGQDRRGEDSYRRPSGLRPDDVRLCGGPEIGGSTSPTS